MNKEMMQAAFADEAFVKGLFELETAAEVQAALKEKGIEVTEEEILSIRELFIKVENGEISVEQLEDGELPEDMLEQVAGGAVLDYVSISVLMVCVAPLGIGLGALKAIEDRW